ncbi:MAG: 30S ribosomal protein S8, small subunit ribosomal protein S8 [Candidatus Peregrinibacteria bacterium GW2011_GWE2_39_6]|nr:MAG: 30S ribosomal protein S8, small subunit ribosomal protein S8 [Candidatus Peregrinibacteria bacterium GW2011_GWF2_39_17]KKR26547.1 MAG: 30S ribosomal protein S8, small subunit ribosomal protein S8 [Candidatus Peregrinibacteria bacterium GW2011_GWE2_39_6]
MKTDPIADLLTRIRNAAKVGHQETRVPYSKMKYALLQVMEANRFIEKLTIEKSGKFSEIKISLPKAKSLALKRISKPGQRIYIKASQIPAVLNGLGIAILSTPKGIMSGLEAKKQKLGGEILCEIY